MEQERLRAELASLIRERAAQEHASLPSTRFANAARAVASIAKVETE